MSPQIPQMKLHHRDPALVLQQDHTARTQSGWYVPAMILGALHAGRLATGGLFGALPEDFLTGGTWPETRLVRLVAAPLKRRLVTLNVVVQDGLCVREVLGSCLKLPVDTRNEPTCRPRLVHSSASLSSSA